jgi:hypothetical protein
MGILNLDLQNKCLLSKWLFKLLNEDGLWQDILKKKYLQNKGHHSGYQTTWRLSLLVRAHVNKRGILVLWFI